MSSTMKIAIVLLCLSLCGTGAFTASAVRKGHQPQKTNVIPVKNREVSWRIWIVT